MVEISRTIDAGVVTEVANEYVAPFHILKLVLPTGTSYFSEGPAITHESQSYLAGRMTVNDLSWNGEAGQSCAVLLYNEQDNAAADLFIDNVFAEASATVWLVYQKANGTFTTPVLYIKGTCEDPELRDEAVLFRVIAQNHKSKFMPNSYIGEAGFNHLPVEGSVVFWNSGTYVLERMY